MRPKRKLLDDMRVKKKPSDMSIIEINPVKDAPLVVDLTSIPNEKHTATSIKNSSDCVNDSIVIISECGEKKSSKANIKRSKRKRHDDSIEICYERFLANFTGPREKRKKRRKCSEGDPVVQSDSSFISISPIYESVSPVVTDVSCTVTSTTDDIILIDADQESTETDIVVLDSGVETSPQDNSAKTERQKKKRKKKNLINPLPESFTGGSSSVTSSTPNVIVDTVGDASRRGRYKSPLVCMRNVRVEGTASVNVNGANIYNPNSVNKTGLRPIVIDGSNVAFGHGKTFFSVRGLIICLQYFLIRGHMVVAFVPLFRRNSFTAEDRKLLDSFEKNGQVVFTPSRYLGGRCISPYDDRYIVQYAAELGGVIVSNDNFRDLVNENEAWRETINRRLLMFTWVGDILMFPEDPNGRTEPRLEQFLRFPP